MKSIRPWIRVCLWVLCALIAVSCGSSERAPSVSGPAETESVDSGVVGVLAGPSQVGPQWTRTDVLVVGSSFSGTLAANDRAAVVVGLERAYYSSDGVTWPTPTSFLDDSFGWGWPTVAGGANGFVAASYGGDARTDSPHTPWVLFSADGQRWERIPPAELPEPQVTSINHAVAGPNGFLVSVQAHPSGENTLWFSEDGRNWMAPDIPTSPTPLSMATDGSGWMALNHSNDPDGRPSIVYTSVDGVTWTELIDVNNAPDDFMPHEFDQLIGGPPLVGLDDTWILAQRNHELDSSTAWVSTDDGRSWDKQTIAEDARLADLVVIDDVFVAICSEISYGGPAKLYFSNDAEHWQSGRPIPNDIHDLDWINDNLIGLDSRGGVYTMNGDS